MGNINLVTSEKSDILVDTEVKNLKSIGYKLSKVDFINTILEEIYSNDEKTIYYRKLVQKKLNEQELQKEKRYNKIRGVENA